MTQLTDVFFEHIPVSKYILAPNEKLQNAANIVKAIH